MLPDIYSGKIKIWIQWRTVRNPSWIDTHSPHTVHLSPYNCIQVGRDAAAIPVARLNPSCTQPAILQQLSRLRQAPTTATDTFIRVSDSTPRLGIKDPQTLQHFSPVASNHIRSVLVLYGKTFLAVWFSFRFISSFSFSFRFKNIFLVSVSFYFSLFFRFRCSSSFHLTVVFNLLLDTNNNNKAVYSTDTSYSWLSSS